MHPELAALLTEAVSRNASDIHLAAGRPPAFRVDGALVRRDGPPPAAADLEDLILSALPEMTRAALAEGASPTGEAVLRLPGDDGREFSLLAFRAQGGIEANVRVVLSHVPTLEQVASEDEGTLETLRTLATLPRGLVLITGPSGSGKVTTAAALVEHANRTAPARIYVLEESPGYTFRSKEGIVTTLRIGQDFDSYERAAYTLLRGADPDIVFFSDLPTLDAVRQALVLADTGHLVVACLTAESAAGAITDLVGAFGEGRETLRSLLGRTLAAVTNQRLLPRAGRSGRVAAYELLRASAAVREAVGRAPVATLADDLNALLASEAEAAGHRPLDAALDALVAAGHAAPEQAAGYRADRARSASYAASVMSE